MSKKINKLLVAIILVQLFYTPTVNGVKLAGLLASEIFYYDSVDSINWGEVSVGDQINLGEQTLDHFENYSFVNSDIMYDLVNYNPETETINVDTDSSNDRRTAIFEPEYQLDLNQVAFFGTRFSTDVSNGVLANRGYISLMTRPSYSRLSSNADWANSGTGENVWTINADSNKLALKYRENGKYINTLSIPTSQYYNTLSMTIDPDNNSTTLSICTLPDGDTEYDCSASNASDVYSMTSKISAQFLNNEFASIAYSPGVDKKESTIHIEGLTTIATVESYGEIDTKNPVVYVPLGTSLQEVHTLADPRYNEFIDYIVTAVEREVPVTDIVDNGGYNSNAVGRYLIRYNVTRGYEGGVDSTDTIDVEVYDPAKMITLSGEDTTYPIESAPATDEDLISALNEHAIDPQTGVDLTDQIGIYSYGGFDFTNPKAGDYDITFYVKDENNKFIYDTHTLSLVSGFDINDIELNAIIVSDSTNDMKIAAGDQLQIEATVKNNSNVDIRNGIFEYKVDQNYLNPATLSNVSGALTNENITEEGFLADNVVLKMGESLTFTFEITANEAFIIMSTGQDLDNTNELMSLTAHNNSQEQVIAFPLAESLSDNVVTTFNVVDENNNGLLATDEHVTATAIFENKSDYAITNVEIDITELTEIVNLDNVEVASSLRSDFASQVHVEGHDVIVDEVIAHEVITITEYGTAISEFGSDTAADFNAVYNIFAEDGEVAYQLTEAQEMELDIAAISSIDAIASITDQNDQLLYPGETFEIVFVIENTGSITEHDITVDLDFSDINILNEQINSDDVEMHFSKADQPTNEHYDVEESAIIIDHLVPGEKVSGIVNLQATNSFIADEYLYDLLAIAVTPEIEITTAHSLSYYKHLSIALDHTAYANTNVNVHQIDGDGDNMIDNGETFEIVADIAVDGNMPVPNLEVAFGLNENNGAIITDVNYQVLLEGTDITDQVTVYDDVVTLPNAKHGEHYKVIASVTYGNGASNTYSSNTVTTTHPYLQTQSRTANIQIDTSSIKNISFEALLDKAQVTNSDTVHVTAQLTNNGLTTENDLVLSLSGDSTNINLNNPVNISLSDGTYTTNGSQITLSTLLPGETIVLEFDLKIADTLTIDAEDGVDTKFDLILNGKLSDGTEKNINFQLSPKVETVDYSTSLTGKPLIGGNIVHTSDYVEYTYTLTNGDDINITNANIALDLSDDEIISLDEVKVVSTDPRFSYQVNEQNISFKNLSANQSVTVTVVVTTADSFNQSSTIDFGANLTSDYVNAEDSYALNKDLEGQASIDADTNLISTSSGNMLVGKDEVITYNVHIINDGSINLEDVVVQTVELHENFTDEVLVDIIDENGDQYTDYTLSNDQTVILNTFKAHQELTLTYEITTNDTIAYDPDLEISTIISNELVNKRIGLPLSVDLSHLGELEVHYSLEETLSDSDGKVDPGEVNYIYVTITNTDSVVFDDVHVIDTMDDPNLESYFESVQITDQTGADFTNYVQTGNDVFIESFPGETTLTFKYKLQAADTFTAANFATISADVSANYPSEGVLTMPYEQTIPIDRANNLSYTANLQLSSADGSDSLAPGDGVKAEITVENTGTIDLENVEVIPNVVSNVDETTIALSLLDSSKAMMENNKIIIYDIPAGATEKITVNFKVDSTFNDDEELVISGNVRSRLQSVPVEDRISLDRSGSNIEAGLELILESGDGDGKVDPGEVYELDLVIRNSGNTELSNIDVDVTKIDPNIKSKTYIGANTIVTTDGDTKIIESLLPGQEATLRYEVVIKDALNGAGELTVDYLVTHPDVSEVPLSVSKEIDVEAATSYKTSISVIDEDESGTAGVNEPLNYTYTLTNDGTRELTDLSLILDISDLNLDASSLEYEVYINDQLQSVVYDNSSQTFTIPSLNVGETLTLNYTVNTTEQISSLSFLIPIYRVLNVDVESNVRAVSADETVSNKVSTTISIAKEVANIQSSSKILTNDGDNLLDAGEEYTQEITVLNSGDVDTQRLLVRFSTSGKNIGSLINISIYDNENTLLTIGTDYTIVDNQIEFPNLPIGEHLTIKLDYRAPDSLYAQSYVAHKAVVVPKYNNSQTLTDTLYTSVVGRDITYELSHDLDDSILDVIGKQDTVFLTINNLGTINEQNVVIDLHERTTDFIFDPSTLYIEKNGKKYTDYILDIETMSVTLGEINSGDQIVMSSNVVIDADMNAQDDPVRDFYELEVIVDAIYEDGTDVPITMHIELPKTILSTIDSNLTISENIILDNEVEVGTKVKGQIVLTNSNFLRQERATIEINPDARIIEDDSFVISSIVDAEGNAIDSSKYSIDGNVITLLDFRYGQEWTITYRYKTEDIIDFDDQLSLQTLNINDQITIIDDGLQQTTTSASTKLAADNSSFVISGEANDETNNGKVGPGEKVEVVYDIINNGKYVEYNVPIQLVSGTNGVASGEITEDDITLAYGGEFLSNVDYTFDSEKGIVYIKRFAPGEIIHLTIDYTIDDVITNQDTVHTEASVESNLGVVKNQVIFMDVDLDEAEHMAVNSSLDDANNNSIIEDDEVMTYSLNLVNNGNVNYMHVVATIDVANSAADIDPQNIVVYLNGEVTSDFTITEVDDQIVIDLYQFEVGENYDITFDYKLNTDQVLGKSVISTNIAANHFTDDSTVMMRTEVDTVTPEIDVNTAPVIDYNDVTVAEGTNYNEDQLKAQIAATATDAEDGDLEVVYGPINVDYNTPGSYSVELSATDSYGVVVNATASIIVEDLMPSITSSSEIAEIEVGTTNVDYISLFGVVATEIESGDLTSEVVVDDSNIDVNTTGTYPLTFTVSDNEGNNGYLILSLNVVRTFTEPDIITPDVDGNYPPTISANDIVIDEETLLTDSELISLANVVVNDYEDSVVTAVITSNQIDYSKPGTYELQFTAIDSGEKSASITIEVTVQDLKPQLTADRNVISIPVGTEEVNYITAYGLVASEVTNGDLTTAITVDDSDLQLDVTGVYDLMAEVRDEEGNTVMLPLTVNVVRTINPDIESPENGLNTLPVLSYNDVIVDEETQLSTDQLKARIGATSYDGEDGNLEVEYKGLDIDYSKPGEYQVDLETTDSSGATVSATATVTVNDLLPTFGPVESQTYIEVGSQNIDYVTAMGIQATEITNGDLTDKVVVDASNVSLDVTGTYIVNFSVSDNEGNSAYQQVPLIVVRDLDNIDEIEGPDSVIEANVPPTVSASDIIIPEETVLSDEQLISLANASGFDFEDGDLQLDVEHDIDFTMPGQYSISYSATDSGSKTSSIDAQVIVIDLLPTIEANKLSTSIIVGSEPIDYVSTFGLVATEVKLNDLTNQIEIDDSSVDYNKTGIYTVIASIVDQEGNVSELELTVNVIRNIITDPEIELPVIESIEPVITANINGSITEETVLTEKQLLELFKVSYNSGPHLQFTVTHNINYHKPGTYQVIFTNRELIDESKTMTVTANLIVEDLLPVIESEDSLVIARGDNVDDYLDDLNITATEVVSGDLTERVEVDASRVDSDTLGTYHMYLNVNDEEGNIAQKRIDVTVVNSLSPILTAEDAYITSQEASLISSGLDLININNAIARDYNGHLITDQIVVTDTNGIMDATAFSDGDQFEIEYTVTNSDNRTDSAKATITISEQPIELTIKSNSPVVFSIDDNADLEDITSRAHVRAYVTTDEGQEVHYLKVSDIVSSDYIQGEMGLFFVKYQYSDDKISGTHDVIVYISEDGEIPDNSDIVIETAENSHYIMPGDEYVESFTITNNSFRTKTMSTIKHSSYDQNIDSVSKIEIVDQDGQVVATPPTKTRMESVISDLEIPSSASYTINITYQTNDLFTYRKQLETNYQIEFDGEIRNSIVNTKVDSKAIDVNTVVEFDKPMYKAGEHGTLEFTVTNDGTMDSDYSLLSINKNLTNIKLGTYSVDGLVVDENAKVMIPAKSSIFVEVDFTVNDTILVGDDIISILDDIGHTVDITIPIDNSIDSEVEVEGDNDDTTDQEDAVDDSIEQQSVDEKESNAEQNTDETKNSEVNAEISEATAAEKGYKKLKLMSTGSISLLAVTTVFLIILVLIKKYKK